MPKLIQHVASHLQRAYYREIKYPDKHDTISDDFNSLKDLRELMYKLVKPKDNKVRKAKDIVLITYNSSTRITTDIYLKLQPPFQLIVQSPLVLYSDDREDVETIYEYNETGNEILFHPFTPHFYNIEKESLIAIYNLRRAKEKVVVLGTVDKVADNIHFISDLNKIPNDVVIVIDTMLNNKHEYINFVESIDRLNSFNNVIYYRLMDRVAFDSISMSNKVDIEKILHEAIMYDESLSELFDEDIVAVYNKKMKFLNLTLEEKEYMEVHNLDLLSSALYTKGKSVNKAAYAFLAILLSNVDYVKDMIYYPPLTDDLTFNDINRLRLTKLIKEEFGSGLILYTTILRRVVDTLEKMILDERPLRQKIYEMLQDNNINSRIVANIFTKMLNEFEVEVEEIYSLISLNDVKIVKLLKKVYGYRRMSLLGSLYHEGNEVYTIDTYYVSQDFIIREETITPLVVDEEDNIVYLYI